MIEALGLMDRLAGPEIFAWGERRTLPLRPSEYFQRQCWIGASLVTPAELELRHAIGVRALMWGADYPHVEGTWPHTKDKLRETFKGIPEAETRAMLGENAARAYGVDVKRLAPIVERVGPKVTEILSE